MKRNEFANNEIKYWLKKDCKIIEEKDIKEYLKDVHVNLIIGVKKNDEKQKH